VIFHQNCVYHRSYKYSRRNYPCAAFADRHKNRVIQTFGNFGGYPAFLQSPIKSASANTSSSFPRKVSSFNSRSACGTQFFQAFLLGFKGFFRRFLSVFADLKLGAIFRLDVLNSFFMFGFFGCYKQSIPLLCRSIWIEWLQVRLSAVVAQSTVRLLLLKQCFAIRWLNREVFVCAEQFGF